MGDFREVAPAASDASCGRAGSLPHLDVSTCSGLGFGCEPTSPPCRYKKTGTGQQLPPPPSRGLGCVLHLSSSLDPGWNASPLPLGPGCFYNINRDLCFCHIWCMLVLALSRSIPLSVAFDWSTGLICLYEGRVWTSAFCRPLPSQVCLTLFCLAPLLVQGHLCSPKARGRARAWKEVMEQLVPPGGKGLCVRSFPW